jgi:hypothetical protein
MASRGYSQLLAASRRLAQTRPQATRPDTRIAHAFFHVTCARLVLLLGRSLCVRWSTCTNAARRRQPTQARVAGDSEAKCRRRGEAPTARRWRLGISTLIPQNCRAGSSESSRWHLGVVALAHQHCRAGASALTTLGIAALVPRYHRPGASALPRLCIGIIALAPRHWRHCHAGASALSRWFMPAPPRCTTARWRDPAALLGAGV